MKEDDFEDYSLPVYTSLMETHLFFGIGEMAFCLIAMVTIILATIVSAYCILLGIIAVLVCRMMCKKEPMLINFIFQNLLQQDKYLG